MRESCWPTSAAAAAETPQMERVARMSAKGDKKERMKRKATAIGHCEDHDGAEMRRKKKKSDGGHYVMRGGVM